MKNLTTLLTAFCLACAAHAVVIPVDQDSYIRNGSQANNNFGSDEDLWLKPGATSFFRMIYLDFDVTSVPYATTTDATLSLDVLSYSGGSSLNYTVYGITDAWDQSTITWNNAPYNSDISGASGPVDLGSATILSTDTELTFSSAALTNYIANSTGEFSLVIFPTGMTGNVNLNFYSSENTSGEPVPSLDVTVVPEPSSYALMFSGLVLLVVAAKRRLKK